jgi:putative intracellular protease/amidase
MNKNILFIVSSANSIGPNNLKTGNFLPEVAHPYHEFAAQGYNIDFASIQGGTPPLYGTDIKDLADPLNKNFMNSEALVKFNNSAPLASVDVSGYDALFIPGGLGPMVDMPENAKLQQVIASTYERGAVISAVCHGPASLLNVKLSDGSNLIKGKRLTSFTNHEEEGYAKNDVPFLLESALKESGAEHIGAPNWEANTIVDGRLVTGQNPASAKGVAVEVIALLERKN